MAFLTVNNVKIKGISACVPAETVKTQDYQLLSEEEIQNISSPQELKKDAEQRKINVLPIYVALRLKN